MSSPRTAGLVVALELLTASVVLVHAQGQTPQPPRAKLPVPDAAAQQKALDLIREVYKADYDKARTPAEKARLAENLLSLAGQPNTEEAGRYVLLQMARDLAVRTGDAAMGLKMVDVITGHFEVDGLAMRVDVLLEVSKGAMAVEQRAALARQANPVIDAALARDDYETAARLGRVAAAAARKARSASLAARLTAVNHRVQQAKAVYARVAKSLAVLEKNPSDPGANLAAGRYYCFVKADWTKGVSMLARGSDPVLAELARKELAGATSPDDRAALGDGWYRSAEREQGPTNGMFRMRAAYWYSLALPKLTGPRKLTAERRLQEIPYEPMEIISALYGVNQSWFDVTAKLRKKVRGLWSWSAVVSNEDWGDPAPGYQMGNTLVVHYRSGDRTSLQAVYQGREISLSASPEAHPVPATLLPGNDVPATGPPTIHAITAIYGVNQSWFDVTTKLQEKVDGLPAWRAIVTNADWGDPAPGYQVGNTLIVRYSWRGQAKIRAVYQGRPMTLP